MALASGPLLARADELPSRQVTVGIMGLNRGMQVAAALEKQPGVIIKYVCDVDSRLADKAKSQLERSGSQRPQSITDFRRILDDREVDALFCEAPNHWHGPATILGCAAGKHVYVEKPCSHNPWEGEQMIAAARGHDRAVQMGVQRRSTPGVIEAVAKLHQGVIGSVYCARGWYNNARPSLGKGQQAEPPATLDYDLWQGPAPRAPYYDNRIPYNWHWFWQWGNGELGNNGVHALDLCRWGLNVEFPSVVVSSGGRYRFQDDQQTPDTHIRHLRILRWEADYVAGPELQQTPGFHGVCFFLWRQRALPAPRSANLAITRFSTPTTSWSKNARMTPAAEIPGSRSTRFTRHISSRQYVAAIISGWSCPKIEKRAPEHVALPSPGNMSRIGGGTQRTLKCNPENGHVLDDEAAMTFWQREYEPGWKPSV